LKSTSRQRQREEENLISAYHRQQKEIKEWKTSSISSGPKRRRPPRAQAKIKYLEKMERSSSRNSGDGRIFLSAALAQRPERA